VAISTRTPPSSDLFERQLETPRPRRSGAANMTRPACRRPRPCSRPRGRSSRRSMPSLDRDEILDAATDAAARRGVLQSRGDRTIRGARAECGSRRRVRGADTIDDVRSATSDPAPARPLTSAGAAGAHRTRLNPSLNDIQTKSSRSGDGARGGHRSRTDRWRDEPLAASRSRQGQTLNAKRSAPRFVRMLEHYDRRNDANDG